MMGILISLMHNTKKALKYGLISIGLIYVIGFSITLITENFNDLFAFNISSILLTMLVLFVYKILPFIPLLLLLFFVCNYLVTKNKIGFPIIATIVLVLFIVYGVLVWGGEFFSLHRLKDPGYTFSQWWTSETINWHFSIASFIATIYFVWMTFFRIDELNPNTHN